ncbi:MAG: DUF465 domain-containing protein [Gammaproteobacteria bacterium]|nr:DUF465 domain-containing protein [Gammaproteobacteria bacterium]
MFEFDQDAVDALLVNSAKFRRLYDKYGTLKTQVQDAHARQVILDDLKLESLKKAKLQLKDKMAVMIKGYRQVQA